MTRVVRVNADTPEESLIREAAAVLQRGGLVAFPTETVYGLGAHALDAEAVARIFAAKGRPATDPLIVHLASADALNLVAEEVPTLAHTLAATFWPGPLTLILKKRSVIPDTVTARRDTVAVRVPSGRIALHLITAAGIPIAAPSANRFSRPSPTEAAHVLADLEGRIDVLIDGGPTPIGVESTILDLTVTPPVIRRPGGVSPEEIGRVIPEVRLVSEALALDRAQPAPGQLLRHYAPRATLTLFVGELSDVVPRLAREIRQAVAAGERVGVLAPEEDLSALAPRLAAIGAGGRLETRKCGSRRDRHDAARELFRALRDLDETGVDVIFASAPVAPGIDTAIVDRLTRAADGRVVYMPPAVER